jgi:hypothetical protein
MEEDSMGKTLSRLATAGLIALSASALGMSAGSANAATVPVSNAVPDALQCGWYNANEGLWWDYLQLGDPAPPDNPVGWIPDKDVVRYTGAVRTDAELLSPGRAGAGGR